MRHPYLDLLGARDIRVLWSGLAVSAAGSDLYRVGAIWLAVGLAGEGASLLVAAQSAAMLLASLAGGAVTELLPRRRLIVAAHLASAVLSLLVVAAALTFGLTLPLLIAASAMLAALAALATPALISGVPLLVPEPDRLRAVNGLFDTTTRTAQVAGPFLAAAWAAFAPAIHLLTLNAVSFLASAGAVAAVGHKLDNGATVAPRRSMRGRLARGVRAASGCPGVWPILLTTGVRGAAMAVGFTVGVPLLLADRADVGSLGLAAVAMVFAAAAAGELLGSVVAVTWKPRRPWRWLFAGYATIGAGIAVAPVPALVLPMALAVPAMAVLAFAVGVGGAVASLQMWSFLATRLEPDDYAAVLRLRLALVIGATMLATTAGPWLYGGLGVAATMSAAGVLATAAAVTGYLSGAHRDRREAEAVPP